MDTLTLNTCTEGHSVQVHFVSRKSLWYLEEICFRVVPFSVAPLSDHFPLVIVYVYSYYVGTTYLGRIRNVFYVTLAQFFHLISLDTVRQVKDFFS